MADIESKPDSNAKTRLLTGRRRIFTNIREVTSGNVVGLVNESMASHLMNVVEINYLWNYYRGRQPILDRTKEVRPEINNKVVENHAQECVDFKLGYQLSDPVQYVSRGGSDGDTVSEEVKKLNDIMYGEDKETLDYDLFEQLLVVGTCPRIILPDSAQDDESINGGGPFEIFNIDPRQGFVVYSDDYRHDPVAGVYIGRGDDGQTVFNVYAKNKFFSVIGNTVVEDTDTVIGFVPIIEYELNNVRMGVFEPVLPILDAINAIESNRLDGIEQTVQSLMKFINCDIDEETFIGMLKLGAVKVTSVDGSQGDVDIIRNDLDQTQTQVTKDDLYQAFLSITGMPNRAAGVGNSDTGAAVIYRDGWALAEAHAKSYELRFKKSEKKLLEIAIGICSVDKSSEISLHVSDVDIKFNRRNYDNILTKSQVLTTMLDNPRIHPLLAFQSCGMFTDPEAAYLASEKHYEESSESEEGTEGGLVQPAAGQP